MRNPPSARRLSRTALTVAALWMAGATVAAPPASAHADVPLVTKVGQIAQQDVPSFPGSATSTASEPDTLVEPDVAVSPLDPDVAVAAAHDSRFPDGGAVGITHVWTHDGGKNWKHAPVPGITKATGGSFDRASDPVLAFGPDGDVYLSTIALNDTDCRSVVFVSRSTDRGATFGPPVAAQSTDDCDLFNDKNWIVVDNGKRSPHRGRVYQFWTFFTATTADQALRWSDDHGRTWSALVSVTSSLGGTQNSQASVLADGTIVDTYLDYTGLGRRPENERTEGKEGDDDARTLRAAETSPGLQVLATRSTDGGATWSAPTVVAEHVGFGPDDVRCCLHSGTADPVTGTLYVAYSPEDSTSLLGARSSDAGRTWTPITLTPPASPSVEWVNVDVSAYDDRVTVSTGRRDLAVAQGRYWNQTLIVSSDGGRSFGPPVAVGPAYDTQYGAFAGAVFPGDYIGTASTRGRTYVVWPVASAPADPTAKYHQVLYGATLKP